MNMKNKQYGEIITGEIEQILIGYYSERGMEESEDFEKLRKVWREEANSSRKQAVYYLDVLQILNDPYMKSESSKRKEKMQEYISFIELEDSDFADHIRRMFENTIVHDKYLKDRTKNILMQIGKGIVSTGKGVLMGLGVIFLYSTAKERMDSDKEDSLHVEEEENR